MLYSLRERELLMSNEYKIGVVGGGAWGTAIAKLLSQKEKVLIWVKEKSVSSDINKNSRNKKYLPKIKLNKKIKATNNMQDLKGLKFLFVVVPTQYISEVFRGYKNLLDPKCIVVCCSKGIEIKSLNLASEIIEDIYPNNKIAVMSGPNFANEIAKGLPAAALIASRSNSCAKTVATIMKSKTFRPYLSNDVVGAQIAGALKNIYAIACGIVVGKNYGDNAVASIITRSFSEICIVGQVLNAKKDTLSGLSGIGDLFLTCSSTKSRNFSLGIKLAKGVSLNSIVQKNSSIAEGVFTVRALKKISSKYQLSLPIGDTIYQILYRNKNIDNAIQELLNRPLRKE